MPIPNYDNTLVGRYIRLIENPDSVGFDRQNRTWASPEKDPKYKKGKYDKNNRGFGVDVVYNDDARKVASKNRERRLTELEERNLRNNKIKEGDNLVTKYQDSIPSTRNISPEMRAMAIGAIYRGDGPKLWKKNNVLGEAYATGDDEAFNRALYGYYRAKNLLQRATNHDAFMEEALKQQRLLQVIQQNNILKGVEQRVKAAELWADGWKERIKSENEKKYGGLVELGLLVYVGWEDLPLKERAAYIETAIRNGVTTLPEIKLKYKEFAEGGNLEKQQETNEANTIYGTNVNIARIPNIYGEEGNTHQLKIRL